MIIIRSFYFMGWSLFSALTWLVAEPQVAGETGAVERPNIVVVLTDDQGYADVGVHGNSGLNTPNLDRFAAEGVELRRFYVSPVCAPTRASLLTGRYYYRTGVIHTSRGGAKMSGDEITIAELLGAAGYKTGIFGKWHLGDNAPMRPQDQGFSESLVHKGGGIDQAPDKPNSYFDPDLWHNGRPTKAHGYCTDVFFDAAIRFIESNRNTPFFVYLPTNAPHTPLQVDTAYSEPYSVAGLDETTSRAYGMITNIDDNFGRLLNRLSELGLKDRTLVVFMGDNGPQQQRYNAGLRARKSFVYEGGIRVPFFVQWPGYLSGGRKTEQIAAHIDILPTLLAVSRASKPASLHLDGRNLLPLLKGDVTEWPDDRRLYLQCHRGLRPKRYQNFAAVTQRYKLVGDPGTFSVEDLDTERQPVLELYDLGLDPGEKRNLAQRYPRIVETLRLGYESWFESVKSSRNFRPGVIRLRTDTENPVRLCRYQDATYRMGIPDGWVVELERPVRYRVTVERGSRVTSGRIYVQWLNRTMSQPLEVETQTAEFEFEAGTGVLDIWFQEEGKGRVIVSNNSTVGDVELTGLN